MKLKRAVGVTTITGLCAAWSIISASQSFAATTNFTYTGGVATWTAPTTDVVEITAVGAGGGGPSGLPGDNPASGGDGAVVISVETVRAGETLHVRVGGGANNTGAGGAATSVVRSNGTALVVAGGGGGGHWNLDGGSGAAANTRSGGNGQGAQYGRGGSIVGEGGSGGGGGIGGVGGAGGTLVSPNGANGAFPGTNAGGGGFASGGNGGSSSPGDAGGTSGAFNRQAGDYSGGGGAGFGGGGGGNHGGGGGGFGGGGGGGFDSSGGAGGSYAAGTGTSLAPVELRYYAGPVIVGGLSYGDGGSAGAGYVPGGDGYVSIRTLNIAPPNGAPSAISTLAVSGGPKAKKRAATWTLPPANNATRITAKLKQKGTRGFIIARTLSPTATKTTFKRKVVLKKRKSSGKKYAVIITAHNDSGSSAPAKKAFRLR